MQEKSSFRKWSAWQTLFRQRSAARPAYSHQLGLFATDIPFHCATHSMGQCAFKNNIYTISCSEIFYEYDANKWNFQPPFQGSDRYDVDTLTMSGNFVSGTVAADKL